jgi:hypothetical protein
MLANIKRDRVEVQLKTTTLTAGGETEVYTPVQTRYALVKPLGTKAIAEYQQLNSEVFYEIIFDNPADYTLGNYRFKWKNKTLIPSAPPRVLAKVTIIPVKET